MEDSSADGAVLGALGFPYLNVECCMHRLLQQWVGSLLDHRHGPFNCMSTGIGKSKMETFVN